MKLFEFKKRFSSFLCCVCFLFNNFLLLVELRRWSAWLYVVFSSLCPLPPPPPPPLPLSLSISVKHHPCFCSIHVSDILSATLHSSFIRAYISSPTLTFSVLHIWPTRHEFDFFFSFGFGRIYYYHFDLFIVYLLRSHRPNRLFSFLSPSVLACVCLIRILR